MQFAGAFGGGIAGTVLATVAFSGLNYTALIPVSIVLVLSGVAFLRKK
jgi:riboflavin transporter FmnP